MPVDPKADLPPEPTPLERLGLEERQDIGLYYSNIRLYVSDVLRAPEPRRSQELTRLGRLFFDVVRTGVPATIDVFLKEGMPPDYRDPQTGETALHVAAGVGARQAVRLFLSKGWSDFLVRDVEGRLPSEHAYLFGRDPVLARLLAKKERQQAAAQGIRLRRRPGADTG